MAVYTRQYQSTVNWENFPNTSSPINRANLRHMDDAIMDIDMAVTSAFNAVETGKANQADALTTIVNVVFDAATGVFTFTKLNGTTIQINTLLEKVVINWSYDAELKSLLMTLEDGTVQQIDLSDLIPENQFKNSAHIVWTRDPLDNLYYGTIVDGSITPSKLQPNYLADVTEQALLAHSSADDALLYSRYAESYTHGGTNLPDRPTENVDNARQYMLDALQAKNDAEMYYNNVRQYSQTVVPELLLDTATGALYIEDLSDLTVDFALDDDTKDLYWKVMPAS